MSIWYIYMVLEHLHLLWMGIWLHTHTITTKHISPDLGEVSVQTMPLCYGWGCRTLQTASHIHIIHIYGARVPSLLWMGIWLHTHTTTTTHVSPDLGELAEILGNVSVQVQTMPLQYDWGCRTFQTASHIHILHIYGVWAPSSVVDGHMATHSHCYHHIPFPELERELT